MSFASDLYSLYNFRNGDKPEKYLREYFIKNGK